MAEFRLHESFMCYSWSIGDSFKVSQVESYCLKKLEKGLIFGYGIFHVFVLLVLYLTFGIFEASEL